jgi:uncharacterized membrane protein
MVTIFDSPWVACPIILILIAVLGYDLCRFVLLKNKSERRVYYFHVHLLVSISVLLSLAEGVLMRKFVLAGTLITLLIVVSFLYCEMRQSFSVGRGRK